LANLDFKYIYISESTSYVILVAFDRVDNNVELNAVQNPLIVENAISVLSFNAGRLTNK
jgi:hypothetical protein